MMKSYVQDILYSFGVVCWVEDFINLLLSQAMRLLLDLLQTVLIYWIYPK